MYIYYLSCLLMLYAKLGCYLSMQFCILHISFLLCSHMCIPTLLVADNNILCSPFLSACVMIIWFLILQYTNSIIDRHTTASPYTEVQTLSFQIYTGGSPALLSTDESEKDCTPTEYPKIQIQYNVI